jgi:hypothetical protein
MDCNHVFTESEDQSVVCVNCGLEQDNDLYKALDNDLKRNSSNYSVRVPVDDLNYYLEELPVDIKSQIINTFEKLLQLNNLRGNGKKALLAACYFYLSSANSFTLTCRDVYHKFKIDKKKFSEGKQLFLTHFPEHRTLEKKISEYVDIIFSRFSLPETQKELVSDTCKKIDDNTRFVNFNPYSVCACVVYQKLNGLGIKKNVFIKRIGMSEVTVQKITICLQGIS